MGFREHIFSESAGLVAGFAASSEFIFGTLIQRFQTWPLMVRFHYGHPDVWDKLWCVGNGGVSKVSYIRRLPCAVHAVLISDYCARYACCTDACVRQILT